MALKKVKSLADINLPDKGTVDVARGETTLRIPVKVITQADQTRITEQFRPPAPPVQWRKRPDTGDMEQYANELDGAYQEELRKKTTEQTRTFILSGIDIDIPGKDDEEKWKAISERFSLGEMNMILTGIMELSQLSEEAISEAKNSLVRTPQKIKTESSE